MQFKIMTQQEQLENVVYHYLRCSALAVCLENMSSFP